MSRAIRSSAVLCLPALAAIAAVGVGCAQGQGPQSHGPAFRDDASVPAPDAGNGVDAPAEASALPDTGSDAHPEAGSVDSGSGDSQTVDSGVVDAPGALDSSVDAASDSARADSAAPGDGSACSATIAVVGGSSTTAFGATSYGAAWSVSSLTGTAASNPALAAVPGGFHAVFRAANNALQYSTFATVWSTPLPIGTAITIDLPSVALVGPDLHLVYRGTDSKFYHGTYASNAWDTASDPVSAGGVQSFGPSAPSAASAAGDLVIAQDGSDGTLYDQSWSGSWQAASQHANALVGTVAPSLVAGNGGTYDLFVVFVHQGDFKLYWSGRTGGAWSAPALVDPNAYTSYPVALAALPSGRFVLVYEGSNQSPYFSLFDPASGAWSAPAGLVGAPLPVVLSPPAVAPGVCGADAVAIYSDGAGVEVVTLSAGTWTTPSPIGGTAGSTYAAVATSP